MKRVILFALALLVFVKIHATTWTVNNNTTLVHDFTTVQAAVDAAAPGDTIYIQPSAQVYDEAVTINKQLVIIGGGHAPEFSNGLAATVYAFNFTSGSSNSILKGMKTTWIHSILFQVVNNVLISDCRIEGQSPITNFEAYGGGQFANWTWEGNVIISSSNSPISLEAAPTPGWVFRNNYILAVGAGSPFGSALNATDIIENNVVVQAGVATSAPLLSGSNVTGVTWRNNIFYFMSSSPLNIALGAENCVWENNITYAPSTTLNDLPGNTNLNNTDPEFVNVATLDATYSYQKDFHLTNTSVGHLAGTDGTDIGLFGGVFPFSTHGFDYASPRIGAFTLLNSLAPQGGTIDVHIRAYGSASGE